MTSSPATTRGPAPRYRCRACGRTLSASQAILEHVSDPFAGRPAICGGVLEPVGGDQLVTGGAGGGDEGGDRGHDNNMRPIAGDVTAHASDDGSQPFAREAACPR